jgi:serine/threonine protein kinase
MGLELTDVSLALEALGFQTTDRICLHSFVHRLHKQQERYYTLSDRYLVGNTAPILSVQFNEKSKLVYALDKSGCLCIWDPCCQQAYLAISDAQHSRPMCGPKPYALVSCQHLAVGLAFAGCSTPTVDFASGVTVLPVSATSGLPFPVDRSVLAKAFQIEASIQPAEEPPIKGFVYVMKDFSYHSVEVSGFSADLVSMSNPQLFTHSPFFLGKSGLSSLQSIYRNRQAVLRVIYVVSSSHRELASLCVDLSKYGVITRGYTTTPSDQIHLVCFERGADWYTLAQSAPSLDINAGLQLLQSTVSTRFSGIVVSMHRDVHGKREYSVAANLSNDILTVPESKMTTVLGTENEGGAPAFTALHGFAVGSQVEFSMDVDQHPSDPDLLGELGSVVVKVTNDVGEASSYLIPFLLGRSSFPVPANQAGESISEHTKLTLAKSYLSKTRLTIGRNQMCAFLQSNSISAWERSAMLQKKALLHDWVTAEPQAAGASQGSGRPALNKGGPQSTSSALLAFSGSSSIFAHFLMQQAVCLLRQRVISTHPFVAYLQEALGHMGEELVAAFYHKDEKKSASASQWAAFLDRASRKWFMRKGVAVEEMYQSGVSPAVTDVELLVYRLQKLLDVTHSHDKSSVGPASVQMLPFLLSASGPASAGKDSHVATDGSLVTLNFRTNLLRLLLAQHQATIGLNSVVNVAKGVKKDAVQILCSELDALMKPITIAVKSGQAQAQSAKQGKTKNVRNKGKIIYRDEKPASGQYTVSSRAPVDSLFPGVTMEVYTAHKARTTDPVPEKFMVWKFSVKESEVDRDLLGAVAHLPHLMGTCGRHARVVRALDGVSFDAEADVPCLVLEWSPKWKSLMSIVASRGGFLGQGKIELLRLIASNVLSALVEMNSAGCALNALNPNNIILEENGSDVLLMLLPTANEADQDPEITRRSGAISASYAQLFQANVVANSCLPRAGKVTSGARAKALSPSQCDSWAFGASLFIAAFGVCPFHFGKDATLTQSLDGTSQTAVTGSALFQLLQPVLVQRKTTTEAVPAERSSSTSVFEEGTALCGALKAVLTEESKTILFSIVRQYTGQSMDYLLTFRSSFCAQSLTCGLTEWATGALWEKIVQNIFVRVHGGLHEVSQLKDRIATLPKPLTDEVSNKFLVEQLGLELSKPEIEALITSLTPPESKDSPHVERLSKMYKRISVALEEIFYYGLFQQLLHVICACFSVDPASRPHLSELQSLAFFDIDNESATAKASREAKLLMMPFQSDEEFHRVMLKDPLTQSLRRLVLASAGGSGSGAWKVRSDLEIFSTCIARFEDLVSGITSDAVGKTNAAFGAALQKTGADQGWLRSNSLSILEQALNSGYLPGISLFLQRFLGTDYAKNLDTQRSSLGTNEIPNVRGISLGSKLASRVSKFFQHLVHCMAAMSSVLTATHLTVPSSEHEEVLVRLRRRHVLDMLFNSTLTALLMLLTGEESTVPFAGSYHSSLKDAHPALFDNLGGSETAALSSCLTSDSRWNVQMCKLFEPPLIDLVGEDGAGSSKVPLSVEMIKCADKLMNNFTANFALSFPSAGVQVARKAAPVPYTANVQSRGSLYFVGLVRYVRGLCVSEASSAKTNERSQQGIIASVILLLPTPSVVSLKTIENTEEAGRIEPTGRYLPEGQWWQKIQVVLDARCGARLQSNFSSADVTTKLSLLKLCQRALLVCLALPGELMEAEPFLSLGQDFSSAGWVHGISEMLRTKTTNADLAVNAIMCLRLMAHRAGFMRSWSVFQIMPILCNVAKQPGRDYAILRLEAQATLKLATASSPAATEALITLRVPNLEAVQGMIHVTPIVNLLIEANDMSFGSTLEEQKRFAMDALSWMNSVFPAEVPFSVLAQHNFDDRDASQWNTLFDVAAQVISWVPKLCLALVVTDAQDSSKREKTQTSCLVAIKQLQIVERIILYALSSGHPSAAACVVRCLWAAGTPMDAQSAKSESVKYALQLIESQINGNGLIACIDQLTSTGTFIDTFLSLRLQFTIMHVITRLMKYGSADILSLMCSCGIVRTVDKFLQGAFLIMKDVPRLGQQGLFMKQYKEMTSCLREVWGVLVGTRDGRVYEDILDLNLIQKMVQDWLPSMISISFGNIDPDYNPLAIRVEALRMLQTLVAQIPASDRLIAEVVRWVMVADTIRKELTTLRTVSTKKGTSNAKRTAAEVLATLASISAETLDQEFLVRLTVTFMIVFAFPHT